MRLQNFGSLLITVSIVGCQSFSSQSPVTEADANISSNQVAARYVSSGGALTHLWTYKPGTTLGAWTNLEIYNPVPVSFDLDGKQDLYLGLQTGFLVYRSNGSNFEICYSCEQSFGGIQSGGVQYNFGDFNGDGRTDIIFQPNSPGGYEILLSTGKTSGGDFIGFQSGWTGNWPSTYDKITVGDFNGDGYDDLFIQARDKGWGGYHVYLNNYPKGGTSFSKGWSGSWPSWGDRVVAGKFTNNQVSDVLVTADRSKGVSWGGWSLLRAWEGNRFVEVAKGGWPSWGERISVGKVLEEGPQQILVNANLSYTNWNGFRLLSWNRSSSNFETTYSANWPSSREIISFGRFQNATTGNLFVRPNDPWSAVSKEWRVYAFPVLNPIAL